MRLPLFNTLSWYSILGCCNSITFYFSVIICFFLVNVFWATIKALVINSLSLIPSFTRMYPLVVLICFRINLTFFLNALEIGYIGYIRPNFFMEIILSTKIIRTLYTFILEYIGRYFNNYEGFIVIYISPKVLQLVLILI